MKSSYRNKSGKATSGFTLIEIMVVLGIIGTILALSFQAYSKSAATSRVASATGTAKGIQTALTSLLQAPGAPSTIPLTEAIGTGTIPASQYSGTGGTSGSVSSAATLDGLLLTAGFLQQPIAIKMGSQNNTPLVPAGVPVTWQASSNTWVCTALPTVNYGNCTVGTAASTDVTRAEAAAVDPTATPGAPGATNTGVNFMLDGATNLTSGTRCAFLVIKNVAAGDAYNLAFAVDGPALTAASGSAQTKGAVAFAAAVNGLTDVFYYVSSQ